MSLPIHNMMPKLTTSRAPRPHQSRLVICTLFGSMTRSPRTVGAIFTSRGRRHVDLNQAGGCRSRRPAIGDAERLRSEEHTSELQSLMRISYAVFCLKKQILPHTTHRADRLSCCHHT